MVKHRTPAGHIVAQDRDGKFYYRNEQGRFFCIARPISKWLLILKEIPNEFKIKRA